MSKKAVRERTKQPGIYKNLNTGKYDVKYNYTETDPYSNEKIHRQKWFCGNDSYTEAKDLLAKLKGDKAKPVKEGYTLARAMELWNDKAVAGKYSLMSIRNTRQQFNMIKRFWSEDLAIEDITEEQYLKLITKCREYGYSEETIWNINACLRKIVRLAYKNRYINEDPTRFWDNPRIETGVRRNVITAEEFEKLDLFFQNNSFYRLGENNYPKYRFLVNLLYYSGMRIGEAIALTYEDFEEYGPRGKTVMRVNINKSYNSAYRMLKGTKTGKTRRVPIPGKVAKMFASIKAVHLNNGGTLNVRIITWDHSACRMMLAKACKAAEIKNYCCHDFRHTYISNLIKKGIPLPIIEAASGDTQETIFKHYSHMFEGDEKMLIDALEER